MKKYIKKIYLLLIILIGFSCQDFLELEPQGQIDINNLAKSQDGLVTLINGSYEPLIVIYNNPMDAVINLASDDVFAVRADAQAEDLLDVAPGGSAGAIWNQSYRGIFRANEILENLEVVDLENDNAEDIIKGQALFLRGFYYFNLVRIFGAVPLFTNSPDTPKEAQIARTDVQTVYNQIIKDLSDAAVLLPANYTGSFGQEKGRATKGAALTGLSKVYLTLDNWQEAAATAKEVMDLYVYNLHPSYMDNFQGKNENGIESIFEIQYSAASSNTASNLSYQNTPLELSGNNSHLPTDDTRNYYKEVTGVPSVGKGIVQAYEEGDLRKQASLSKYEFISGVGAKSERFPEFSREYSIFKYWDGKSQQDRISPVNHKIFRYAEVLLIRAEALNELGQTGEALDLVNLVRNRAGLDDLEGLDQATAREAIWKERRVELAFEFKRLFDLNRTGRFKEFTEYQDIIFNQEKLVTNPITGKQEYLYPIPQDELDNNANMTQNPGY